MSKHQLGLSPILFLMLTLLLSFCFKAQSQNNLRQNIESLMIKQRLAGVVWATVTENGDISTDAYGYKNGNTKEAIKATDKVNVGSVSKTIFAAGFLRMATLGLINLDEPLSKYLPNLPIQNSWNDTNPVTIRHLLDHTSGLTDIKLWHVFSTSATPSIMLETIYLKSPEVLRVQAKPGAMYSYSNVGFTVLGMVIEAIAKKSYEEYLEEIILKPIGMTNSSFQFISQAYDKQLAYGHFEDGKPVAAMPMYLRPAGQFTTTAEDMGKFLRFIMSDGTIKGEVFIEKSFLNAIGLQKQTDAFKNGVPHGDALGAYTRDRYGVLGIAKNGNTLGFTSMIYMFPDEKKAFFVGFNMDSETANYDLFNEKLVESLGLKTRSLVTTRQKVDIDIANWSGYYVPVITKVEPFGLLDYVFSHTKVDISEKRAMLIPFQGKGKNLTYQGKHLFSMQDRTSVSHAFYKTAEDGYLITDGVKTIKKASGFKIVFIALSLVLGLLAILHILFVGFFNIIKHQLNFIKQPIFLLFFSVFTLFVSFLFISTQSFMNIGDFTIGNTLLAISTTLLPLSALISFVLSVKRDKRHFANFDFWAIVFTIQFCLLLIFHNLMPIIMWQ